VFVTDEIVRDCERRFGLPEQAGFRVGTRPDELAFIRRTQKNGRAHDVTIVIRDGDRYAGIAKHPYPEQAFRFPSGGLEPGEALDSGARREALEETGLDVEITRYLLRAEVRFQDTESDERIDWTTHVVEARPKGTELAPQDLVEIREAAWVTREELTGPIRERLVAWRDHGGIRYRWQLHEAVFAAMDQREGAE
jgi:ADP-ribose pyrophosphatase YjhB (NUDIX family)